MEGLISFTVPADTCASSFHPEPELPRIPGNSVSTSEGAKTPATTQPSDVVCVVIDSPNDIAEAKGTLKAAIVSKADSRITDIELIFIFFFLLYSSTRSGEILRK
jgi:hypothetical protein